MPICPICKTDHDPGLACFDKTGQALQDIGLKRRSKTSRKDLKETEKKANAVFIIFLLVLVVFMLLMLLWGNIGS